MRIFNLHSKAKAFISVCFSLLIATSLQAIHPPFQAPSLDEKVMKEILEITKDLTRFSSEERPAPIEQSLTFSAEEYGCFAGPLAKLRESVKCSEEEARSLNQAFRDVDIDDIFTPEVLFNQSRAIEKRKQLNQLLIFLDKSEKRTEKIVSDFRKWMLFKAEVSEATRRAFLSGHNQVAEEKKRLRQETYRIKKDLISAYIKLFDFLSAKISNSDDQKTGSEKIIESDEDCKKLQAHCDTIERLLKADEGIVLSTEKRRMDLENLLSRLARPSDPAIFLRIAEIYKEKVEPFNQAFAEIDWHNIYTEAVVSSIEKIAEKKKALEDIYPILDDMEKKWEKEIPDLIRQTSASTYLSNRHRKKIEELIKTVFPLEKRLISIKKKYALEYLKLLNFLSARYGSYKIDNNRLSFSYEIENKLSTSYLKNIHQLLQEEQDTKASVRECALKSKL